MPTLEDKAIWEDEEVSKYKSLFGNQMYVLTKKT